jgi:hypothetical protein
MLNLVFLMPETIIIAFKIIAPFGLKNEEDLKHQTLSIKKYNENCQKKLPMDYKGQKIFKIFYRIG